MDLKPISGAWLNSEIAPNSEFSPNSDKFGLVDLHRLLTWVWSTPEQAIPLIFLDRDAVDTYSFPLIGLFIYLGWVPSTPLIGTPLIRINFP